jgi:hypothetical protein
MCNHLNLKILIHIFTIVYLIMNIIIMRGENFVAHLDGLGGTLVCRGTPVAHHCSRGPSIASVRSGIRTLDILNNKLTIGRNIRELADVP